MSSDLAKDVVAFLMMALFIGFVVYIAINGKKNSKKDTPPKDNK